MRYFRFIWLIIITLSISPACLHAQKYIIKFATLATEGSTWINVMKEYDQAVRKESGGQIGFKIYAGGVQGDEKDVLRKIRLGQLQSAGVTGNGLTTVAPAARILDSPFLFRSYDEADYIHKLFDSEFNQAFEKNGFVNLGWVEVGFVYVFTNTPVQTPDDMKRVKMWMWESDPIAEAAFKTLSIHPIPLSITDVLTSLQTGLIDGVYTSPYAAIALQWFSRTKYMLNTPLADASGSVIIAKKTFDGLPKEMQDILLRNGKKFTEKLTALNRRDNAKAIETLKKNGIVITYPPSAQAANSYESVGKQARLILVDKLFSKDLLDRVEKAIAVNRANHTTPK